MTELRNYTIQFRKDTAANWQRWNPVLGEGEPGYDTTANRFKVGDGVTAWNSLPFHQGSAYDIARDKGFVGTEAQWVASLKGPKGDKGDKGDRGIAGVGIKGDKGDRGPKGEKGDKGDTGVGLKGDKGDKGEEGRPGTGIHVLGNLDNTSQLPTPGKRGDAYAINTELWVWSPGSYTWVNAGTIRGEKGDKGNKGDKGDAGIVISTTKPTDGRIWLDPTGGPTPLEEYVSRDTYGIQARTTIYATGRPDIVSTVNIEPGTWWSTTSAEVAIRDCPVGTMFISTDGASVGAWVWNKRPKGWVVTSGETSPRVMPKSIFGSAVAEDNTGTMTLQRVGHTVIITLSQVRLQPSTGSTNFAWNGLPSGFWAAEKRLQPLVFRPLSRNEPILHASAGGSSEGRHLYFVGTQGSFVDSFSTITNGYIISGTDTYITTDAWPVNLPGTPA